MRTKTAASFSPTFIFSATLFLLPLLLPLLLAPEAAAQRSFVGNRMTGIKFVDTEGHTIDPNHYEDSVLVMISGIPW